MLTGSVLIIFQDVFLCKNLTCCCNPLFCGISCFAQGFSYPRFQRLVVPPITMATHLRWILLTSCFLITATRGGLFFFFLSFYCFCKLYIAISSCAFWVRNTWSCKSLMAYYLKDVQKEFKHYDVISNKFFFIMWINNKILICKIMVSSSW